MSLKYFAVVFSIWFALPAAAEIKPISCKANDSASDLTVTITAVKSSIKEKFLVHVSQTRPLVKTDEGLPPQAYDDTFLVQVYESGHFLFFFDSSAVDLVGNPLPFEFSLSRLRPGTGPQSAGLAIDKVGEFQTGTTTISSFPVIHAGVTCIMP